MKTKYDISTKEKEVSCLELVDDMLDKLGFKKNVSGTKMIRNLTIYIYNKDPISINLKKEINSYIEEHKINLSYIAFRSSIDYAVDNIDEKKFKDNFYNVFQFDFDYYYKSTKYIISFIVNILEKNMQKYLKKCIEKKNSIM